MRILPSTVLAAVFLVSACSGQQVTDEQPAGEGGEWTEPGAAAGSGGEDGTVTVRETMAEILTRGERLQQDLLEVGDRVFFDYDKSTFLPEGEETLRRQAQFLTNNPGITVTVEGHCDERGTREYNLALGERRAEAAKAYIVSLGVDPARISTISYGKERPTAGGHDEFSWAQNRVAITMVNR